MTPVSLRLKNFLSYGNAAGELDFEAFSVACLSGGNGQGKSALLDALTWAVWGEARKSSDSRKPDEELLRVGANDMEVEFVFDLAGTRYRIVRSFHRSASKKTSKPGLEFHVRDPEADAYRALTAETVRATQAVIDGRVGIDYDTFINSAFLLQGRSDEFTRKRAGERKDILGRILGLDRYNRYAVAAGQRYGDARERAARHEAEVERLKASLEDAPRWEEEHAATEKTVAAIAAEVARLRAEEAVLAEKVTALDTAARESERLRDALRKTEERRSRLGAEAAALAEKIAAAESLVARAPAVEAAYARHESLLKERRVLDEKANLRNGIERQLQDQRLARSQKRMQLEGRLDLLTAAFQADQKRLDDDARRLAEWPRIAAGLEKARAAEEAFARLRLQAEERRSFQERSAQLDKQLVHERGHLKGELNTLRKQLADARRAAVPVEALYEEEGRLAASVADVAAWQREQETVREAGTGVKEQLAAAEAERARLREETEALGARRARIRSTDADDCPTCGTRLTEQHRRHVEATYDRELEVLREKAAAQDSRIQALEAGRDDLRRRFVDLRTRVEASNGAAVKLAQVRDKLARHAEDLAAQAERQAHTEALERLIEDEAFLPEVRAERTQLQDRLDAAPFDEARFDAARAEAARVPMLREQLEDLAAVAAARETLARQAAQRQDEAARLRADLDAGTSLAPVQRQIEALTAQLDAVGYDGARHEALVREVEALAEAPEDFARLMHARRDLADWTRRRADLDAERAEADAEGARHAQALAAQERALADRPAVESAHAIAQQAGRAAEARQSEAQHRLGALRERLERCAQDRAALGTARAAHREAKRESTLYRHLRSAFGKHGIPSLIIEETLPEIEDRANELLERLSSGRTRVALETLADKKTGGTKETLDIRITDEGGQARAYETFSGGEAFRVNFALRIALSQLLTARAGVPVRTLVVDEGFGTQDREGIQNLVEAIRTIQDDFDKILVVTHLDELKDAFPIRIEVTKRPVDGSTFEVVGV